MPHVLFSTKNDKDAKKSEEVVVEKKTTRAKKETKKATEEKKEKKVKASTGEKKKRVSKAKSQSVEKDLEPAFKKPEYQLYTLKFNSPILPFAKFPLTQNKYIQDFLRKYDEDKDKIQKVIGVHFLNNSNTNAVDTVGIEIEITKRNNITIVESNSNKRYKIKSYDEISNFCIAEEYEDAMTATVLSKDREIDPKYKDLLMSELYELKNIWFMYNKKINSMLVILPQEILNRYDMVAKTL